MSCFEGNRKHKKGESGPEGEERNKIACRERGQIILLSSKSFIILFSFYTQKKLLKLDSESFMLRESNVCR